MIPGVVAAGAAIVGEEGPPPVGPHRYWGIRLLAAAPGPYIALGELFMVTVVDAARAHTNAAKVVGPALGIFGNTPAQTIADRAGAYGWMEYNNDNGGVGWIAGYDFDTDVQIEQYRVQGHWHPDRVPYAVKDYDLVFADASPGIAASWTTFREVRGDTFSAVDETHNYLVNG